MIGSLGAVVAAATFFVASHLLLPRKIVRGWLVERVGETAFLGLYSAVALGGLVWLLYAGAGAPYVEVWPTSAWARHVPLVVMPFAAILLVCGVTTRNPTAIGGRVEPGDAHPAPGIMQVTRHPTLWAFALWALAHMPANGDAASLVVFGTFAVLALAGMPLLDRKRSEALGATWGPIALTTSVVPFAALFSGRAKLRFSEIGAWRILAGVALYLALLVAHGPVIGVSPLPV